MRQHCPAKLVVLKLVCGLALLCCKKNIFFFSKHYIKTLIKLKARIACIRSEKKKTFLLQHNNGRPHVSLKTTECVTKFGWTVLPYLPYSPDLAPSNFHLFGPLKEGL